MDDLDVIEAGWRQVDEDLRVLYWRAERLTALGYELRAAAVLALSQIDIHELERLIGKGCPPETAVRIAA